MAPIYGRTEFPKAIGKAHNKPIKTVAWSVASVEDLAELPLDPKAEARAKEMGSKWGGINYKQWRRESEHYDNSSPVKALDRSDSWTGVTPSYGAVKGLLLEGWTEVVPKLDELGGRLEEVPHATQRRRKRRRGDQGDSIDMDRVRSGDLDKAWDRMVKEPREGPATITLVGMMGANCSWTAEEMFWNGAAQVALVDRLEEAGYRVEYIAANASEWADGTWSLALIPVKRAEESMRPDLMMGLMANSGTYRLNVFQWFSTMEICESYSKGFPLRESMSAFEEAIRVAMGIDGEMIFVAHARSQAAAEKLITDPVLWDRIAAQRTQFDSGTADPTVVRQQGHVGS